MNEIRFCIVILNSIQNLSGELRPFLYAATRFLSRISADAHPREILNRVQNDNDYVTSSIRVAFTSCQHSQSRSGSRATFPERSLGNDWIVAVRLLLAARSGPAWEGRRRVLTPAVLPADYRPCSICSRCQS